MMSWTVHKKGVPKTAGYVAVAVGDKVYSLGGGLSMFNGSNDPMTDVQGQIDVHVFNTVSLQWLKLPVVTAGRGRPLEVPQRVGHTAVLIKDIIYIWGGFKYTREYCNVLYAFDVDTHRWSKPKVSGSVPQGRCYHSACVLGKVVYIYGGSRLTYTNDTYKLDTATMVWSLIKTSGTPALASSFHSATIIGKRMLVFGGKQDHRTFHNNVRVFDTETNVWLSTAYAPRFPGGYWGHSAFAYNGELYIYRGISRWYTNSTQNHLLWKFNPETLSWKQVEAKGKGPILMLYCGCMVGDRSVVFGTYRMDYDQIIHVYIFDLCPCLKALCKLAVIQYGLKRAGLPHNIRWELTAMSTNRKRKHSIARFKLKSKKSKTLVER